MVFYELFPVIVRTRVGFDDLRAKAAVGEVPYLDLRFKRQPRFEFELHCELQSYLEIVVADDEHALLADILNQALETMRLVHQFAFPADLKTARTLCGTLVLHIGIVHVRQFSFKPVIGGCCAGGGQKLAALAV
ncbi:hypothetical protein D3C83_22750 [compost metagenome]